MNNTVHSINISLYVDDLINLYTTYYHSARHWALTQLKDPYDADDVVMEAFNWIIENSMEIFSSSQKSNKKYLSNIVYDSIRRISRNYLRRIQSARKHMDSTFDLDSVFADNAFTPETYVEIHVMKQMLNCLPNKYKKVLNYSIYGYSTKQIAQSLHTTPENIRKIKYRARQLLKRTNLSVRNFPINHSLFFKKAG